jgi:RHS repeat-associated protein
VGDWNSITTNGTAQNRTHGPTHELLTAGGQNVTTDVKGNITLLPTTLTTSGVAMAIGYDFDNKLKSADVDNNGSNDVTFQYDALGRRVARQGTSGSFVYVQHDQQTIADYGYGDAPSSPTHRYVYASYIDEPVVRKAAGTSGTIYYLHRNQQFSITAATTSTGSVAERYAYTAYGQPTILDASGSVLSSSAINNRYAYTGREWDATLGMYHFRARWMSGLAGQFMGRDPIGYEGSEWGLYEFFDASPIVHLDPTGLLCGQQGYQQEISKCFNQHADCMDRVGAEFTGCMSQVAKETSEMLDILTTEAVRQFDTANRLAEESRQNWLRLCDEMDRPSYRHTACVWAAQSAYITATGAAGTAYSLATARIAAVVLAFEAGRSAACILLESGGSTACRMQLDGCLRAAARNFPNGK